MSAVDERTDARVCWYRAGPDDVTGYVGCAGLYGSITGRKPCKTEKKFNPGVDLRSIVRKLIRSIAGALTAAASYLLFANATAPAVWAITWLLVALGAVVFQMVGPSPQTTALQAQQSTHAA
jgi:predicted membrane-bound spermidine synthase